MKFRSLRGDGMKTFIIDEITRGKREINPNISCACVGYKMLRNKPGIRQIELF